MNEMVNKEYLFLAAGMLNTINTWGITLRSSNPSADSISFVLDDNVFPPYASHKFLRSDIIKIRDYLNDYLDRIRNE